MTLAFFKEVQNKLLWAVSGKTAAELMYYRANASLPNELCGSGFFSCSQV